MSRRGKRINLFRAWTRAGTRRVVRAGAWALTSGALACGATAQSANDAPDLTPSDAIEVYLQDRGLDDLLGVYLLDQMREARGERRADLADRLGGHYADQLSKAETPERQREIEALARDLLAMAPDSDSFELRLTLHTASFLLAESTGEKYALRLAEDEAVDDALETFRMLEPAFERIGKRVDDRVRALERMEDRSTRANIGTIRDQLAEARRLRSLAMYYAGWSHYYQALINNDARKAQSARRSFGWLLNAPGNREPDPDNLPLALLRYDHVARAAMACALSLSLEGKDAEAMQWLDAIDNAPETAEKVREILPLRRIEVLGRARRWADLQRLMDRRRLGGDPGGVTPLPIGEARLIAIAALESIDQRGVSEASRTRNSLLEAIAQVALGDMVTQGEIGHVIDLAERYGTSPMGDTGFVVLYVRARLSYERARRVHEQWATDTGASPDEPTDEVTVSNRYVDAVAQLEVAQVADDAESFPDELVKSRMMQGLSLYYAGRLVNAGEVFADVYARAAEPALREESLWYAIVALDLAVEGGTPSVIEERDRLATLYMQAFPASDRAARLLLRRVEDGLLTDAEAIQVLLEVPDDSALYEAARRHASRLMYRHYRDARGPERDYAAARFLEVAEELIKLDVEIAQSSDADRAREAAETILVRARQGLDASLSITVPDTRLAERLLGFIEDTAALHGMALEGIAGELALRRLQLGLATDDEAAVDLASAQLAAIGGPHARSGDRQVYRRLYERWRGAQGDPALSLRVVAAGRRVLAQFDPLADHKGDRTIAGLLDTIARAATTVWLDDTLEQPDLSMRAVAIEADLDLVDLGMQSATSLKRLAKASEDAGDFETALNAWTALMAGLREGSDGWFEARVESIRVLAQDDPQAARTAIDQVRVLYPDLGPEPWRTRLDELHGRLVGARPSGEASPGGAG